MLLARFFPRRGSFRSLSRRVEKRRISAGSPHLESLEDRTLLSGWAFGLNGTGDEFGNEIVVDTAGDVYVIGKFAGTVDFDPGPGTLNLTSANAYPYMDVFIAKYSSAGSLIWADQFSNIERKDGKGIAVDVLGNVYATGSFQGTVDFDPGPGTYNLTAPVGVSYGYVVKLDASGNLVWAGQIEAVPQSLALANDGGVLTTGYFCCTRDFDPGPGNYSLTGAGGKDIFVLKLDSSGNFVWAQRAGGITDDEAKGVAANSSGVFIGGHFSGFAAFGSTILTSAGGLDNFIAKLDDSTGNFLWVSAASGSSDNTLVESGRTIALDPSGNMLSTGQFSGTVDFDPGPGVTNLSDNGNGAGFVWKLDPSGNLIWARKLDGTDPTAWGLGRSVAVDAIGNIYIDGGCVVNGAAFCDFDPGTGSAMLAGKGIWKLDSGGNFVWARVNEGGTDDGGIAVDSSGNVFSIATYGSGPATVQVDIGSTTVPVLNSTGYGLYIAKTTQDVPTSPQLFGMSDSPDPVAKGGTLTLAAYPVRIVPGGSNVASISFYRDKNSNGVLDIGTDTLLGTDANGSNGWSLAVTIPNNFKTGTYKYFAQAKDSANVTGNVVSTTNTVTTSRTAALVAVRPNERTERKDSHITDTALEDLLRHRGRGLARLFRRFR